MKSSLAGDVVAAVTVLGSGSIVSEWESVRNEEFTRRRRCRRRDRPWIWVSTVWLHVREHGKCLLVKCEFETELKGSGIPLTIRIGNSSSTDKDWNLVPGIRSYRMESQNSRPSWIPLLWANCGERVRVAAHRKPSPSVQKPT